MQPFKSLTSLTSSLQVNSLFQIYGNLKKFVIYAAHEARSVLT